MIRVEQCSFEPRRKIIVGEVRSVHLLVKSPSTFLELVGFGVMPAVAHCMPVPLRIGELAGYYRRIGGDGIRAPMNKDAKSRFAKPLRRRSAVKRIPRGLVCLRSHHCRREANEKKKSRTSPHSLSPVPD